MQFEKRGGTIEASPLAERPSRAMDASRMRRYGPGSSVNEISTSNPFAQEIRDEVRVGDHDLLPDVAHLGPPGAVVGVLLHTPLAEPDGHLLTPDLRLFRDRGEPSSDRVLRVSWPRCEQPAPPPRWVVALAEYSLAY